MTTPVDTRHGIYLPWSLAVRLLKLQIVNRLVQNGTTTLSGALEKYQRSVLTYDPDIDKIMEDLIREGTSWATSHRECVKDGELSGGTDDNVDKY